MARRRAAGGGRKPRGEFSGKLATFSTRITPELRAGLEREAERSGRSLSQEVEYRLRNSLEAPPVIQKQWGPEHIKALAQLVSRATRWVEDAVGAPGPEEKPNDLAWHKNEFTHAAVCKVIDDVLAWYRPDGPLSVPRAVELMTEDERERTPEAVGLAAARMLRFEMARMKLPPLDHSAELQYGDDYYAIPHVLKILGLPRKKERRT